LRGKGRRQKSKGEIPELSKSMRPLIVTRGVQMLKKILPTTHLHMNREVEDRSGDGHFSINSTGGKRGPLEMETANMNVSTKKLTGNKREGNPESYFS